MTRRRLPAPVALTLVALTLVLAACSGDDDSSPTTAPAPPPSIEATSTSLPVTTEPTPPTTADPAPETTEPTPPTEPTASTNVTTAPPADAQIKQDVIDAAFAAWKSLNDLRLDPTNDDLLEALALTRSGASLNSAIEIITNYRARNQRAITHPDLPASFTAYPDSVVVDLGSGVATVEYCWLNSNILVETGGNGDGTDLVLDDSISSHRERSDLMFTESGWRETGGVLISKFPQANQCAE